MFAIFSRGLIEFLTGSKQTAFIIQFAALLGVLIFLVVISHIEIIGFNRLYLIIFIGFTLVAVISGIITDLRFHYFREIFLFSGVIIFLYFIFLFLNVISTGEEWPGRIACCLFIAGIILASFACAEWLVKFIYFRDTQFADWLTTSTFFSHGKTLSLPAYYYMSIPGKGTVHVGHLWLARPASLIGSYLHFPIILPLIGVITYRFIAKRYARIISLIFIIVPFLLFSRSGIIISSFALLGLIISRVNKMHINFSRLVKISIISLAAIAIFSALFMLINPVRTYVISLIARIFNFSDIGNTVRYSIWSTALRVLSKTNLVFGEFTGFSSNIIKNFFNNGAMAVESPLATTTLESGLLEILTSFGLLGALLYYAGLMLPVYENFKKSEIFIVFTMIGVIIETLFYQSVEILPFVFILSLMLFLVKSAIPSKIQKNL